jgi:hypothetical protein
MRGGALRRASFGFRIRTGRLRGGAKQSDCSNRAEIHLYNYGGFDKTGMAWTDGCRNCKRDGGCQTLESRANQRR